VLRLPALSTSMQERPFAAADRFRSFVGWSA
jgi:hypothetical protein